MLRGCFKCDTDVFTIRGLCEKCDPQTHADYCSSMDAMMEADAAFKAETGKSGIEDWNRFETFFHAYVAGRPGAGASFGRLFLASSEGRVMTDIGKKVEQLNALFQEIRAYKMVHPEERVGWRPYNYGSLLNAYREGDIGYADAIDALRKVGRREATIEGVDALAILGDLIDEGECRLDHHGYCQEHGWFDAEECPHARGKRLLKEAGVGNDRH